MIKISGKENLVVGGIFGCLIGGLFIAFGGMGNFWCEMLFWSFVLYVVAVYFEIVPNMIKNMMKKHDLLSQCLMSLAWVPAIVGGMIVFFLGSLLFVDYSAVELSKILICSKTILSGMMMLSLSVVYFKRLNSFRLINF